MDTSGCGATGALVMTSASTVDGSGGDVAGDVEGGAAIVEASLGAVVGDGVDGGVEVAEVTDVASAVALVVAGAIVVTATVSAGPVVGTGASVVDVFADAMAAMPAIPAPARIPIRLLLNRRRAGGVGRVVEGGSANATRLDRTAAPAVAGVRVTGSRVS